MNEKCKGCAFRIGSEANLEPDNHIKSLLCMLTPHPFYCHEGIDWKNPDNHGRMPIEKVRAINANICQGWREAVQILAATGYFKENKVLTKVYGEEALNLLDLILKESDSETKEEMWRDFAALLRGLSKKWKKFQNKSFDVEFPVNSSLEEKFEFAERHTE